MILLILAVATGLFFFRNDLALLWESVKTGEIRSAYIIAAFIILPVFGFPILPLLILMGARFGAVIGLCVVFAVIPIHLGIAFRVTNSVFRKPIEKIIKRRSLKVPSIPETHRLKYGMLFMILPGLSYSLKNYILPLSGLPFVPFMICGWVPQGLLGVPFVLLGNAAAASGIYIFSGIALLYAVFLISGRWITALYRRARSGCRQHSERS